MKRSLKDLTNAASDHFSYLIVYAPDFPREDQTNTDRESERLLAMLREIEERSAETPKKQWLRLSINEAEDAREKFRVNEPVPANRLLHSAEEHFKAYLSGKQGKVSFVVGPNGATERVDE